MRPILGNKVRENSLRVSCERLRPDLEVLGKPVRIKKAGCEIVVIVVPLFRLRYILAVEDHHAEVSSGLEKRQSRNGISHLCGYLVDVECASVTPERIEHLVFYAA
ncbi:MAG TPA: hypothetical protein VMZ05_04915 [Spirochaetota bacterium]|nr:hypothetical protein [Spirochaetota bacterium]